MGLFSKPTTADPTKLEARRVEVFSADTREDKWAQRMLLSIATAKRLGATMFDFEMIGDPSHLLGKQREKAGQGVWMSFDHLIMRSITTEGDEWRSGAPDAKAEDKTCTIRIFAVVITDKDESR